MRMKRILSILLIVIVVSIAVGQSTFWRDESLKSDPRGVISLCLTEGITQITKFGDAETLDGIGDIWHGSTKQALYVFPADTGEFVNIYSDEPLDSGTVIKILGLDLAGVEADTTVVLTADTVQVSPRWRAINRAFNNGGTRFLGNVTIEGRASGNIFAYIDSADQQTAQMPYMTPAGKVAVVFRTATAINKALGTDVSAIIRVLTRYPGKVFRSRVRYGVQRGGTSTYTSMQINGVALPPLTQVRVVGNTSSTADISQLLDFRLYDISVYPPDLVEKLLEN